ncbi:hypothetical protein E4U54_004856, partial [Claviceps lovelessii]
MIVTQRGGPGYLQVHGAQVAPGIPPYKSRAQPLEQPMTPCTAQVPPPLHMPSRHAPHHASKPFPSSVIPGPDVQDTKTKTGHSAMLRQRHPRAHDNQDTAPNPGMSQPPPSRRSDPEPSRTLNAARTPWMFYAIASGACAAFNGVFAKLTTTTLTSALSSSIAHLLHLTRHKNLVEVLIRGIYFALNLTFNGI